MDIVIALSQGAGLAVACGLAALLPLGVLATAALLGWLPGSVAIASETPFLVVAWALGLLESGLRALLPAPLRIAVSSAGGAAACELTTGHVLPWVGLVIGALIGAGAAWTSTRLADRAIAGGGTRWGVTALMGGAAVAVAAASLVPFVGLLLVIGVTWAGIRSRRGDDQRYAGLRVLR